MTVIACRVCGVMKSASDFHKNNAVAGGLRLECKPCRREVAIRSYKSDPEASKLRSTAWGKAHPEQVRAIQKKHSDANREARREVSRSWQKRNRAKDAARSANQRAQLLQATPSWANQKYIALFYEFAKLEEQRTGRQVHVDHIYPLTSDKVCGLHVEDNLQLLFATDNVRKKNHMIEPIGGGLSL